MTPGREREGFYAIFDIELSVVSLCECDISAYDVCTARKEYWEWDVIKTQGLMNFGLHQKKINPKLIQNKIQNKIFTDREII